MSSWTADLSQFGGPADYDFVSAGTWRGLIPPGASFFAEGTLTLGPDAAHANTVEVTNEDGDSVRLTDSDPFHAVTTSGGGAINETETDEPAVPGEPAAPGEPDEGITSEIEEVVRETLSATGVGMAVAGTLLIAIAAVGAGFSLIAQSRGRRNA